MTVSLRVVDTDHLILLFVKFRGSPNLSQPRAHSCVVVAAKAAAAIRSIAGASKNVLFILFPFPERSLFEADQRPVLGLYPAHLEPGDRLLRIGQLPPDWVGVGCDIGFGRDTGNCSPSRHREPHPGSSVRHWRSRFFQTLGHVLHAYAFKAAPDRHHALIASHRA